MEDDLEELVRRHFEEKQTGEEAKEELAEDEVDEDGNKLKSLADLLLEAIEDEEEREIMKKILKYVQEKKIKDRKEDKESGEIYVEEKPMYSLKELNEMVEFWKEDSGYNWNIIEDDEQRIQAYIEWAKKKVPKALKGKKLKPTII